MSELTMKTITVRTYKETNDDCPPENLIAFIEEMKSLMEDVPEQYRADTEIQFRSHQDYDGCEMSIIGITYDRLETEAEAEERERLYSEGVMADIEWLENRIAMLRDEAVTCGMDLAALGVEGRLIKALSGS